MAGIEFTGLFQVGPGLFRVLAPQVNQPQIVMPHEVLRIIADGRFKFPDRRFQITLFPEADAQAVAQVVVLRIQPEPLPVLTPGGLDSSLIKEPVPADIQAEVIEDRHLTGTQQQGMVQGLKGVIQEVRILIVGLRERRPPRWLPEDSIGP